MQVKYLFKSLKKNIKGPYGPFFAINTVSNKEE